MVRALVAASVIVALGAGAGLLHAAGVATKTTTYRDDIGEDPRAPDITTVTVSSDASGVLTLRVPLPSHPILTEDMRIRIWLDSDDDRATGLTTDGMAGVDHFLLVDRWELGAGAVGLFRCAGSICSGGADLGQAAGVRFSYENGATFAIEAVRLGLRNLERLRFSVVTMGGVRFDPVERTYDLTNAHVDVAPDQGRYWTYDARLLRVTRFSAKPNRPTAGKTFALRLAVNRTDTGTALDDGRMSCSFKAAGRSLRARLAGFVQGRAICRYDIPTDLRGRRFRSSISLRFGGATVARSLSGSIR